MDEARTILVVDDDRQTAQTLARALADAGFRVRSASKWTEALAEVQDHTPDLVLLDLDLPTVRGDALLDFIREQDANVPVVLVAPDVDTQRMQDLSRRGASGFLRKPFETDDLLVMVEQIMAQVAPAPAEPGAVAGPAPAPAGEHPAPAASLPLPPPSPALRPDPQARERRRVRKRRRTRSRRKLSTVVLLIACLLAAGAYWMFADILSHGFLGIGLGR